MSGPKVSVYEMSSGQKRNLHAQLNCLQQSLVCCEEIKKSVRYLNGVGDQIQSLLSTFELINQRNNNCTSEISVLSDLQSALPQDCRLFMEELSGTPVLQVDKFTLSEAELAKRKDTLAKLRALRNRVSARHKEIEASLSPMSEQAERGVADVESAIADDVAEVQSFFVMPSESEDEILASEKKKIEEQLRALTLDAACPRELINEVISATIAATRIISKEQLKTFQSVTVRPLQSRIEVAFARKQEERSEYAELQSRLTVLCTAAGIKQNDLPSDDGNLKKLKANIAELEKRIVAQTEQAYISDCVNEVMTEMGYDIIGNRSVVKRSGKRFRNELFSYGDGTAINVTYDSDGQIAMELGGIDRTDRIPTKEEADVLQEDMESFCSDFKDFEERLEEKGVMIKSRVSMAPPSAEYAAIINLSDYTITTTAPLQEMSVSEKRSKTTVKRTMRRESD
jgi:hypothetical protein